MTRVVVLCLLVALAGCVADDDGGSGYTNAVLLSTGAQLLVGAPAYQAPRYPSGTTCRRIGSSVTCFNY